MSKNTSGNNNGLNQFQPPSFYNQQTFPTPGQFQSPPSYPPPYGYPPSNNVPVKPPHHYRGWVLAIFVICFVFAWVDIVAEIMALSGIPSTSDSSSTSSGALSGFATILFIVINIGIIVLDARSFFSFFGRIQWRRLKGWQKAGLGILYLCGAIMPGIYLVFAVQNFRRNSQQSVGLWYQSKSKNSRIGIIAVSLLSLIFFAIITGSMASYDRSQAFLALTPTATAQQITQSNNPTATTASQDTGTTATVGATPTVIPTATATPKPSPTHQPTPTHITQPTPKPTPRPTQPPPATLAIAFTCASAVDYSYGRICVHTLSGAALTITVTYCSGYDATSASLQGTVYSNGSGNYEWDWTPQTKCPGPATASVNASWNGQSTSNSDNFNVG